MGVGRDETGEAEWWEIVPRRRLRSCRECCGWLSNGEEKIGGEGRTETRDWLDSLLLVRAKLA